MRRRRPAISSLLATGRPAARRQRTAPVPHRSTPTFALRTHDDHAAEFAAPANDAPRPSLADEAGALAGEIAQVQRAAGQLRMAEAVLDQAALHLVEMEAFIAPSSAPSAEAQWRRQGIANGLAQLQAAFDVARVNGRKLFSGDCAIEARAAGMAVRLDLPALAIDTLGDPRIGMIATLVELSDAGHAIIAAAQVQVATQKTRVCESASQIGEMIQTLEIALEMYTAAGTTIADDEFAQAVAQTTQADVFLATRAPAAPVSTRSTALRIQRHPL